MKNRNGFVSNSSSASFIVKINDIPKSPNDVKMLLISPTEKNATELFSHLHSSNRIIKIKRSYDFAISMLNAIGNNMEIGDLVKFIENMVICKGEYVLIIECVDDEWFALKEDHILLELEY